MYTTFILMYLNFYVVKKKKKNSTKASQGVGYEEGVGNHLWF